MRFQNKSKPIKFSLVTGGKECRTVDEVKKNFDFISLYENFSNGSLQKWLKQISETDLAREIEKIAGADILTRKIRLYNLFSPEKLPSANVDESNVIELFKSGYIQFEELKNSTYSTNLDILKFICENKLWKCLNAENARKVIDKKIITNRDEIFKIATIFNFSDILKNFQKSYNPKNPAIRIQGCGPIISKPKFKPTKYK